MSETRDTIALWANISFGLATDSARIARAVEEAAEMSDLVDGKALEECADTVICLLACPASAEFTGDWREICGPKLWGAIEQKMAVNRSRKWRLRGDGNGDHISEESPDA